MPQLDTTTYFIQGTSILGLLLLFLSLVWFSRLLAIYSFSIGPDLVFLIFRDFIFFRATPSYTLNAIAGTLVHFSRTVNVIVLPTVRRPLTYVGW